MKIELLAPAGGEQSAVAALNAGADAIYLGLHSFSARNEAENFDEAALARTVRYAHLLGAKVYVALNTLVKDSELEGFLAAARLAWNAGADALLLQDLFLGRELKRLYPAIVTHLSTQAGCCNVYGAELAKRFGFSRAVLARETPLEDIRKISAVIETEVFVQGALCASFSGQCYFSSFAGNNSGNRGRCKQPCRKRYSIDRKGYEEAAYALSLSDLSVGPRVRALAEAGVSSFKIEGRMRRPEYVAAAVKYYRALLDGAPSEEAFRAVKRAYNRGDYTEGLAFGQKETLLSRDVQGHIGEKIGTVSLRHGMPECRTDYAAERGDGLKILRGGKEVGGAVFKEKTKDGYLLASRVRLETGDEVRLTTSAPSNRFACRPVKFRKIGIRAVFLAGKPPVLESEGVCFVGKDPLAPARNAPLTAEEIAACLKKTDGLPFEVDAEAETDGVFLPKAALNALRRDFYATLAAHLCPVRPPLPEIGFDLPAPVPVRGGHNAEIGNVRKGSEILIYKPKDYADLARPAGETYLYLPPLFTSEDEARIQGRIRDYDGIFTDGFYGVLLAEKYGVKLFAGPGFQLANRVSVAAVKEYAAYFALSKEISRAEQDALASENAFALTEGDVRVMDLCFCVFGRTCAHCDKRDFYRLTDESGRVFPLRRYRTADTVCRFEVYNCAALKTERGLCSPLTDNSARDVRPALTTRGHSERSVL